MNPFSKATQNPYVSQFVPLPTKEIGEAFANVEKNYQVGVQAKDQLDVMMASDSYIPGSQDEIEAKKQQDGIRTEIDNLSKQYLTSQIAPHIKKLALQYTTNSDLAKRRQNKKSYDEYVTEVRKSKIPNKEDYIRRSVEDYDATGEWNPINVVGNVDSNTKMSQIATANDLFSTQGYTYNGISDGRVGKFKETRLVSKDIGKAKQTIKTGLLQDTEVMEYYNSEARLQGLTNPSDIADYTNAQIDGRVNEFVTNQFLQNVKTDFEEISLDFGRRGTNKSGNTVVKEAKELVDGFITFKGAGNNGLEQGVKKEGVIQLSTTDAEIKNFDKLAKETDLAITQASKPEYQGLYLEVRNKTKEKYIDEKGVEQEVEVGGTEQVIGKDGKAVESELAHQYRAAQAKLKLAKNIFNAQLSSIQQRVKKELGEQYDFAQTNTGEYSILSKEDVGLALNELGYGKLALDFNEKINLSKLEEVGTFHNFSIYKDKDAIYGSYGNYAFLIEKVEEKTQADINSAFKKVTGYEVVIDPSTNEIYYKDSKGQKVTGIRVKTLNDHLKENKTSNDTIIDQMAIRHFNTIKQNIGNAFFKHETSQFVKTNNELNIGNAEANKIKQETFASYTTPYSLNYPTVLLTDNSEKQVSEFLNKMEAKSMTYQTSADNYYRHSLSDNSSIRNYKSLVPKQYYYDSKTKEHKFVADAIGGDGKVMTNGKDIIITSPIFNDAGKLPITLRGEFDRIFSISTLLSSVIGHPGMHDFPKSNEENQFDSKMLSDFGFDRLKGMNVIQKEGGITLLQLTDGTTNPAKVVTLQGKMSEPGMEAQIYRAMYDFENNK